MITNQPACSIKNERFACLRQDCRKQTNLCLHACACMCLGTCTQPVSSSRQICTFNRGCFCPQLCCAEWSKALFTLLGAPADASLCSSGNVQHRLRFALPPIQVRGGKNKAEWRWKSEHDCSGSKMGKKKIQNSK